MSSPAVTRLNQLIVSIDWYQSRPGPLDRSFNPYEPSGQPSMVPVLRVFGPTDAGQSMAMNVHQVYPYCYVPFRGQSTDREPLEAYIDDFGQSLNRGLTKFFAGPSQGLCRQQRDSQSYVTVNNYLADVELVRGIPFYGYHTAYALFLKIRYLDPSIRHALVQVLQSGVVLGTEFQPHEAHVPYELQFLMDYNLYGMGVMEVEWAMVREPCMERPRHSDSERYITRNCARDLFPLYRQGDRTSRCELEFDTYASRIRNRRHLEERLIDPRPGRQYYDPAKLYIPSLELIWKEEQTRRHDCSDPSPSPLSLPSRHRQRRGVVAAWERRMQDILQTKLKALVTQEDRDFCLTEDPTFSDIPTMFFSTERFHPMQDFEYLGEDFFGRSENYRPSMKSDRPIEAEQLMVESSPSDGESWGETPLLEDLVLFESSDHTEVLDEHEEDEAPELSESSLLTSPSKMREVSPSQKQALRKAISQGTQGSGSRISLSSLGPAKNQSQDDVRSSAVLGEDFYFEGRHFEDRVPHGSLRKIEGSQSAPEFNEAVIDIEDVESVQKSPIHDPVDQESVQAAAWFGTPRSERRHKQRDTVIQGSHDQENPFAPRHFPYTQELTPTDGHNTTLQNPSKPGQVVPQHDGSQTLIPCQSSLINAMMARRFSNQALPEHNATGRIPVRDSVRIGNIHKSGQVALYPRPRNTRGVRFKALVLEGDLLFKGKVISKPDISFEQRMRSLGIKDMAGGHAASGIEIQDESPPSTSTPVSRFSVLPKQNEAVNQISWTHQFDLHRKKPRMVPEVVIESPQNPVIEVVVTPTKAAQNRALMHQFRRRVHSLRRARSHSDDSIFLNCGQPRYPLIEPTYQVISSDSSSGSAPPKGVGCPARERVKNFRARARMRGRRLRARRRIESDTSSDDSGQSQNASKCSKDWGSVAFDDELFESKGRETQRMPHNRRIMSGPCIAGSLTKALAPERPWEYNNPIMGNTRSPESPAKPGLGSFFSRAASLCQQSRDSMDATRAFSNGDEEFPLVASSPQPEGRMCTSEKIAQPMSRDIRPSGSIKMGRKVRTHDAVFQKLLRYRWSPPTYVQALLNMPESLNLGVYYSNPADIPKIPFSFAGRRFIHTSDTVLHLPEYGSTSLSGSRPNGIGVDGLVDQVDIQRTFRLWAPAQPAPTRSSLIAGGDRCLTVSRNSNGAKKWEASQIEGPTPTGDNYGFRFTQGSKVHNSRTKLHDRLVIMSIEVHADSVMEKLPDPQRDAVRAIFYSVSVDGDELDVEGRTSEGFHRTVISTRSLGNPVTARKIDGVMRLEVDSEVALLKRFAQEFQRWDPDFVLGWEIHKASLGYLLERATMAFGLDLSQLLSRLTNVDKSKDAKGDIWGTRKVSGIKLPGRIVLNVWRVLRVELDLTSYTIENIVFHVLHQRICKYSQPTLRSWYDNGTGSVSHWRVLQYYLSRTVYTIEILFAIDFFTRTSEFAKVYGIDFYSVLTRGSQFRVESMLFRVSKLENMVQVSPSKKQVAMQRAAECLPLVMEPKSGFYTGPVLVLDFRSLYPSVMIAYNYCYSTCLGRLPGASGSGRLGIAKYSPEAEILLSLKDDLFVSPNGVAFCRQHVREGMLGRMLHEYLETRAMVKKAMKNYPELKGLTRKLQARQLGLKYVANVTYGYTSASFSGRMPCVEIADSIVQTGREILENAIRLIGSTRRWEAEVVYGDTDSIFVHLPHASRKTAFKVGREIAECVTEANRDPVVLQFEKIYHPCVLLAKKRYVGFKYESVGSGPVFDAKGIETVRRDGCPAVVKTMEQTLRTLFETRDLSRVKQYLVRQFTKIHLNRVSIKDFMISKEVRLGTYINLPPGAVIASRKMVVDRRSEPHYGERVPYVVVYGEPGMRLNDQVVAPEDLIRCQGLRLNAAYYITRQIIPAVERVLNLVGADVKLWYQEMPKRAGKLRYATFGEPSLLNRGVPVTNHANNNFTLDRFYSSHHCVICNQFGHHQICPRCLSRRDYTMASIFTTLRDTEKRTQALHKLCQGCSGDASTKCESLDCHVFFERVKARWNRAAVRETLEPILEMVACGGKP